MVTLNDVALRANVSKMTVSRVINHPEKVTDELKTLVYQAMEELDYQPNVAAKALVKNRSQVIKLHILEAIDTTEPYYMNLLIGIAKSLEKFQYSVQLITKDGADIGVCDGYIITGFREKDLRWIQKLKKPVVLFGENRNLLDYVDSDNQYGTATATRYALEVGYEQIVYIGMDVKEPFELSREKGYFSVMEEKQLASRIYRFENRSTNAANFIKKHLDEFPPNTCFVCSSDRLAIGIERGLLSFDKQIPDEYGIIGFDGVFLDQVSSPKLTTMKQPIVKMGQVCGEMLVHKIEEEGQSQGYRHFLPELIVRESTRNKPPQS